MAKVWFKAKRYGYGWYPATWQAWVCLLVWAVLFILGMTQISDENYLTKLLFTFGITAILIYISYKKGERAHWRWGGKNKDK